MHRNHTTVIMGGNAIQYIIIKHILEKITIIVKKSINKLTNSVKYDFSDLQIIRMHGTMWGLCDLSATLIHMQKSRIL